jgi:hypothetical protein
MLVSHSFALTLAVLSALTAPPPQRPTDAPREPLAQMNTLFGPSGLLVVPTAYATPHQEVQFSTSFGKDIRGPAANYGIIQGVEIGGAFMDREKASNKTIANAKVSIVPENFKNFVLGIGVIDVADAIDRSFYFVASASFTPPNWDLPRPAEGRPIALRLHAGVGTGLFQEEIFGGGELLIDPRFALIGEWDTKNFNGALRYRHNESFAIQLGFQHTDLFLGATYSLRF